MTDDFVKLSNELSKIDDFMVCTENDFLYLLEKVHPSNLANAVNLLHYLSLRSLDIRELQDALHAAGLSSMASSESHNFRKFAYLKKRLFDTAFFIT